MNIYICVYIYIYIYTYIQVIQKYTKMYKIPGGGGTAPSGLAQRRRSRSDLGRLGARPGGAAPSPPGILCMSSYFFVYLGYILIYCWRLFGECLVYFLYMRCICLLNVSAINVQHVSFDLKPFHEEAISCGRVLFSLSFGPGRS